MSKLRSVPPIADGDQKKGSIQPDDLRAQVRFCSETGQIWLREHRMLLVHAEAQALLRKELIDTLGMPRARGLLLRMGYASGARDAEIARTRAQVDSDLDAFITGPQLHTLEGIVRVVPLRLELDRAGGHFYGEFRWENSWEGQWHRHYYGTHDEPVCWTQIGYACGYTTTFMGRPILYKEVECTGMGNDYCRIIGKPVEEWEDASEYQHFLSRESIAEQILELQTQVVELRSSIEQKEHPAPDIAGNAPALRKAVELLRLAAGSRIAVLLLGETGVGKELFARALHQLGDRRSRPFVALNCAALPVELVESELFGVEKGAYTGAQATRPGRFERADGGTLFLDEIGDLPLTAQSKLLRALQEGEIERVGDHRTRKVDVRVVAATNCQLEDAVRDGRFRSDLYYRLNAFQIDIPPLRERKEDIPLLARRFLSEQCTVQGKKLLGFSDKAKRALLSHDWPGNIRELRNVIERGVLLAPAATRIELHQLFATPPDLSPPTLALDAHGSPGEREWSSGRALAEAVFNGMTTLDQVETMLLEIAVDKARGNLSSAARMLGLTRAQLAYRLKRLHEAAPAGEAAS